MAPTIGPSLPKRRVGYDFCASTEKGRANALDESDLDIEDLKIRTGSAI